MASARPAPVGSRGDQGLEKLGGIGVEAGIVAAIGLVARPRRIERPRLGPGEGGGIARLGDRDLDIARHRPVRRQGPQAEA